MAAGEVLRQETNPNHPVILNDQDIALVRLLLSGQNTKEISLIYKVKHNSIQKRLDRIAQKLQVTSRTFLVAAVIINDIISAEEVRELLKHHRPRPEVY